MAWYIILRSPDLVTHLINAAYALFVAIIKAYCREFSISGAKCGCTVVVMDLPLPRASFCVSCALVIPL